jgi:hypothetical protein
MNLLLVLANVAGFAALAAACLKVIETGPVIGPAFSPAARVVILLLVFLALYSAIEALSWKGAMRPGASVLVFVLGLFAVWRTFAPAWSSFLTSRPTLHLGRKV